MAVDLVENAFAETSLKENASDLFNVLVLHQESLVDIEVDEAEVVEDAEIFAKLLNSLLRDFLKVNHLRSNHWQLCVADRKINWLLMSNNPDIFLSKHELVKTGIGRLRFFNFFHFGGRDLLSDRNI